MKQTAETRHYFYSCPSLDLWSVGNSKEEAQRKLREEVDILLSRCSKYDTSVKSRRDKDDQTVKMKRC